MSMAELTNLTDRISHLRDRKDSSIVPNGNRPQSPKSPLATRTRSAPPERRFATDYFMLFVYALLCVALLTQFMLIAWLDIL